jgi:hypothetical protein
MPGSSVAELDPTDLRKNQVRRIWIVVYINFVPTFCNKTFLRKKMPEYLLNEKFTYVYFNVFTILFFTTRSILWPRIRIRSLKSRFIILPVRHAAEDCS